MQWTVLNSAISLMGYWTAAFFVDKKWYGRRRMQVRCLPPFPAGPAVAAAAAAPLVAACQAAGGRALGCGQHPNAPHARVTPRVAPRRPTASS